MEAKTMRAYSQVLFQSIQNYKMHINISVLIDSIEVKNVVYWDYDHSIKDIAHMDIVSGNVVSFA